MTRLDWETAKRRDAAAAGRKDRTPRPVIAWWWTISHGNRCDACQAHLPVGVPIAYSHAQKLALCEVCAEQRGLNPQPSRRYLTTPSPPQRPVARRQARARVSTIAVACPACDARPGQQCRTNGNPRIGFHPSRKKKAARQTPPRTQ